MFQVVQNGRRFAVERDIVQLFPVIGARAAVGMSKAAVVPAVADFAAFTGATLADFTAACAALAEFINLSRSPRYGPDDVAAAWVDSGLAGLKQAAMVCLFFYLGTSTMEFYWKHVRAALPADARTPGGDLMAEALDRAVHAMGAPTAGAQARRAAEAAARADALARDV